jgi:alpha-1,2-mannosyltransferase
MHVLLKREPLLRQWVVAIACAAVAWQWIATIVKQRGDFLLHLEFGRRFRAGEFLYTGGMHVPYPPFWAMAHAPLSLLPARIAMPLFFFIGLAALAVLVWMLRDMTHKTMSVPQPARFWVTACALFLASRFITRDLADGGQNIVLLALAWGGVWLFTRGRTACGATSLGLAIALKCTAAAFVVWFVWKRRWKMAALSACWAVLFSLTPAAWMGTDNYTRQMRTWFSNITPGLTSPDPSRGVLGDEQFQNKSLRPALARYLMRLPQGHPGRYEGRGYLDFLDLDPARARNVIRLAMLAILGAFGWACRRPLRAPDDPAVMWECAAVAALMPLFSPIAWGQHCVTTLPAFFLLSCAVATGRLRGRAIQWALAAVAAIILLTNRSLIGKPLSLLLESYHLVTAALLALAFMTMLVWRKNRSEA